jgi:hypothetical protein
MAYCFQLQARIHLIGKFLQEFATSIEQLAGLAQYLICKQVAYAFVTGIRTEMKQQLLMGSDSTLRPTVRP